MHPEGTSDQIDHIGQWCAGKPFATVDNPFGPDVDVYRVAGKMFAWVSLDDDHWVTVKAQPEDVLALCAQHSFIEPGYHMSKRHWVTVDLAPGGFLEEMQELVDESWRIVCQSLPKTHPVRALLEC